jgi:hypothetical protein
MNPKQLKARFPYMFEGEHIGLLFCRGWFPLFTKLCEDIDTLLGPDKRGFHWVQLKEKFGSARFYWEMEGHEPNLHIDFISATQVLTAVRRSRSSDADEATDTWRSVPDFIDELVREATAATRTMCIVCGRPGRVNQDQPWTLVLCDEHAEQRRRGELESTWFDPQEQ